MQYLHRVSAYGWLPSLVHSNFLEVAIASRMGEVGLIHFESALSIPQSTIFYSPEPGRPLFVPDEIALRRPCSRGVMSTPQIPINTESLFEPLLTSREAAPFLRLHYKTLESMARAGEAPATKKGKIWVFRLSKLNKWIDQELESSAMH